MKRIEKLNLILSKRNKLVDMIDKELHMVFRIPNGEEFDKSIIKYNGKLNNLEKLMGIIEEKIKW